MSAQVDVLAVITKHRDSHAAMALADAYSAQEYPKLRDAYTAVAALIAERDALLEDARRYRFLRDRMAVEDMPAEHPSWSTPSEEESRKFDAAVDAALAALTTGESA